MQLYNDASMYVYKYENMRVGKQVSIKMHEYMYAIMKVFMYESKYLCKYACLQVYKSAIV